MAAPSISSVISAGLPSLVEEIEVHSRFTPPVRIRIAELLQKKKGPPNPVVAFVKPTVILRGAIGQQIIAPGGQAGRDEWKRNVTFAVAGTAIAASALTAVIFVTGARRGKKSERRRASVGELGAEAEFGATSCPTSLSLSGAFGIGVLSTVLGGVVAALLTRASAP